MDHEWAKLEKEVRVQDGKQGAYIIIEKLPRHTGLTLDRLAFHNNISIIPPFSSDNVVDFSETIVNCFYGAYMWVGVILLSQRV